MPSPVVIRAARLPDELGTVRALFREYADGLGVDLDFQGFDDELATLPGKYAEPGGRLLLGEVDGVVVGTVALRPLDAGRCEMKRLFVRPIGRGTGLGRALAVRICDEARAAGYRQIYLDSLATLTAARALYRDLGFRQTDPYVFNPLPGVQFMVLDLDNPEAGAVGPAPSARGGGRGADPR